MRAKPGTGTSYWSQRLRRDPEYRERVNAYARRHYAANKERMKAKRAAWKEASPGPYKVIEIRRDANERRLVWSLPDGLALDLVTDNCFYCGEAPASVNGIDRVDSSRGYEENNVVSCCRRCNTAKLDQPMPDFLAWVKKAHAHQVRYFA